MDCFVKMPPLQRLGCLRDVIMQVNDRFFRLFRQFSAPCALLLFAAAGSAQENEPRVARVQMQLKFEDDVVDVIEPGELLTVVGEQEKGYVILTHPGRRGLVEKVNAVKLSEAVEIYDELINANPEEGRLFTQRAAAWWARGERQRALADFDEAI